MPYLSLLSASLDENEDDIHVQYVYAFDNISPIIKLWEIFRRSRVSNSKVYGPIWLEFYVVQDFMSALVICKFGEDLIKTEDASFTPL